MIAIAAGEPYEPASVKVDASKMNKIRILIREHATGAKPNLAIGFVDLLDAPNDPLATGNRVGTLAGLIDKVKMPPAVALRDINNLICLLEPVHGLHTQVFRMR